MSEYDQYAFFAKTVQGQSVKLIFESLKNILIDSSLIINKNEIKVMAVDGKETACAILVLEGEKFDIFHVDKEMKIGINLNSIYKLLKIVKNHDIVTFFVEKNSNELGIKIENPTKKINTVFHLNLLDLDDLNIELPDIGFGAILNLSSSEFHKVCKDSQVLSDTIEIRTVNDSIIFRSQGDFATKECTIEENEDTVVQFLKKSEEITQGVFNLKFLNLFAKCTNANSLVQLSLKNNFPIMLQFCIGNLGTLKLALKPIVL